MQLQEDGKTKYEELEINGASVVFSTVRLLDNPITEDGISSFCNDNRYREIKEADYGYIERMFSADNHSDNMLFRINAIDPIPNVWANDDGTEFLDIELNHYVLIYAKRAILLQTILIFDKRGIIDAGNADIMSIKKPLSITNLLAIIHDIKNSNPNAGNAGQKFWNIIETRLDQICSSLKIDDSSSFGDPEQNKQTKENEQNIAIQIWDIANLPTNLNQNNISGEYLEKRYELELATLLLLYDEHHTRNGEWKRLSLNQIKRVVGNKTDVLNDHRILVSERICVEISQVDKPSFSDISRRRLSVYGYDSTSTFLWGYLSIIEIGLRKCVRDLKNLCQCISEDKATPVNEILDLSKKRQQVLRLRDQYQSVDEMCIERRHKAFIVRGTTVKQLNNVVENIDRANQHFQNSANLAISEMTAETSVEIRNLIEAFQEYTEEQDRSNDKVTILSLVLAATSIFAAAEYIESWCSELNHLIKGIILGGCVVLGVLGVVVTCCVLKIKKKRRSSKKNRKEKSEDEQ